MATFLTQASTAHYIVDFPAKYGGGTIKFRELPLDVERRLRAKHAKSEDVSALGDDLVTACIVAVSPDIADMAGVQHQQADSQHPQLVVVTDTPPGRAEVWAALGVHRRRLLDAAWTKMHSVEKEDLNPFLDSIQTVV